MWVATGLAVLIVGSFSVMTWSVWNASQTSRQARSALCQVLLSVRAEALSPERDLTEEQRRNISDFYMRLTSLVEDCNPNKEGT